MKKEFNFDRVGLLLHIVSMVKDWPRLAPIYSAAMAELEDMCYKEPEVVLAPKSVPDKASHVEQERQATDQLPIKPRPPLPEPTDSNFPSGRPFSDMSATDPIERKI